MRKYEKISEKTMLFRLAATVAVTLICLAAMSLTAYAYFSCTVISKANHIKTATFKANISITDEDGNEVALTTSDHRTFKTDALEAWKQYTVTITPQKPQSTASTGFVAVTARDGDKSYHSAQLGVDENVQGGKTDKITFKLMISRESEVKFVAYWGTSSQYPSYSEAGEEIKIIVGGITEPPVNNTEDEGAEKTGGGSSDGENETHGGQTQSDEEETPPDKETLTKEEAPSEEVVSDNSEKSDDKEAEGEQINGADDIKEEDEK